MEYYGEEEHIYAHAPGIAFSEGLLSFLHYLNMSILCTTVQYSRYFRLLLLIRAFQHIPALFHALTSHRFQHSLLHLWLNKARVVNCGTMSTKQTFKMQCCRLAGIWVVALQHCNKVMSTLHVSSFSCVINSQDASSCPLPTVLLGSCRITFSI